MKYRKRLKIIIPDELNYSTFYFYINYLIITYKRM